MPTILYFGWPPLTLLFPSHPMYQSLQLASPSPSSSTVFFPILLKELGTYFSFRFVSVFTLCSAIRHVLSFFIIPTLIVWPRLADQLCIAKSQRILYVPFFGRIGVVRIPFVCMVKFKFVLNLLLSLLFTPLEFFTSVLADGFSQEFE